MPTDKPWTWYYVFVLGLTWKLNQYLHQWLFMMAEWRKRCGFYLRYLWLMFCEGDNTLQPDFFSHCSSLKFLSTTSSWKIYSMKHERGFLNKCKLIAKEGSDQRAVKPAAIIYWLFSPTYISSFFTAADIKSPGLRDDGVFYHAAWLFIPLLSSFVFLANFCSW